jgi:hypothetical protein
MQKFAIVTLFVLMLPGISFAHGGRTDASGCHTNRKTGEYHCHGTVTTPVARTEARTSTRQLSDDKNCTDFATQAAAQEFYIAQGGPALDPHDLDRDHDGIACEYNL